MDNRDLSTVGSNFFEISKSDYLCQRLSTLHLKTISLMYSELSLVNAVNRITYHAIF